MRWIRGSGMQRLASSTNGKRDVRAREKERKKERKRERETRDEPRNIANGMNDDVSIFAAVRVIMKRLVTKQYRKYLRQDETKRRRRGAMAQEDANASELRQERRSY